MCSVVMFFKQKILNINNNQVINVRSIFTFVRSIFDFSKHLFQHCFRKNVGVKKKSFSNPEKSCRYLYRTFTLKI